MKAGGGKRKGSNFERSVCRSLSLFWSKGQYKDLCWRSASSGARATTSKTANAGYYGDLVAVSPIMESFFAVYCVEVKHYRDIDITEILRGLKCNKVMSFWRQALQAAVKSNRIPLLVFKPNRYPTLLMFELAHLRFLVEHHLRDRLWHTKLPFITYGRKLCIFNLEEVLQSVAVDRFKELLKDEHPVRGFTG